MQELVVGLVRTADPELVCHGLAYEVDRVILGHGAPVCPFERIVGCNKSLREMLLGSEIFLNGFGGGVLYLKEVVCTCRGHESDCGSETYFMECFHDMVEIRILQLLRR